VKCVCIDLEGTESGNVVVNGFAWFCLIDMTGTMFGLMTGVVQEAETASFSLVYKVLFGLAHSVHSGNHPGNTRHGSSASKVGAGPRPL